jgi:hypothetical protein
MIHVIRGSKVSSSLTAKAATEYGNVEICCILYSLIVEIEAIVQYRCRFDGFCSCSKKGTKQV